jgi:eukaryotic-like serine/threonine-protein kinase
MPHVRPLQADDPLRVGRYRLIGCIAGMPGSGSVYLGSGSDGGEVTISLLDGDWIQEAAERDRFIEEANAARRVQPLCAARILAAGFDGGYAYLASEYVPGPSLEQVIADRGPLRAGHLEALAVGTATGLAAVHEAGLVHGGFGPGHVVLGPDGPRVIEFAISPPYGSATPSADMRAWAYTVLQAAAGGPADAGDLKLLPDPLRTLASQCLVADPAERPSAPSVVAALVGLPYPQPGTLAEGARRAAQAAWRPPPPAPDPVAPPRRQRRRAVRIWLAGAAAAVVAAVVVVALVLQGAGQNTASSRTADPRPSLTGSKPPRPRPVVTVPSDLAGAWSGQVSQNGPADTFTVLVTLASGASTGTVTYSGTSLSCSGNLTVVSDSPGDLKLNQAITHGPCAGGVVFLTAGPSGSVGFSFQGKQGPAATGTLTKG